MQKVVSVSARGRATIHEEYREEFGIDTPVRDVEASQVALLARKVDTWMPKLNGGSEF